MNKTSIIEGKGANGLVLSIVEAIVVRKKEPSSRT
ncbi:transposase [Colletotrichum abscissum]|nr:transposase [Colletotrichum abscissum]KAK1510072.1 transposase [Colletotrichum abscissum]